MGLSNTAGSMKHTLTTDQKAAADAFFDFLMSDAQTFVLSGGAGTGKTYLMKYLCNDMMITYENSCAIMGIDPEFFEVHFTATTNKAAEVLERSVEREVSTIHSFLGLRVKEDFKTGQTFISETHNSRVWENIILFIDESSMIDKPLYAQILKRVKNSKIVFVGDKAQLAPVGEDISEVYKNVDPDNFIHLTQSVRNANSPALMHLCAQLRHTVQTGEFFHMDFVPGAIEYLNDWEMQARLEEVFKTPTDDARILCYTNSRVNSYNEYIREIRGLPPEFVSGDEVIVARTFSRGKLTLNVERQLIIDEVDPVIYYGGFQDVTPDGKEIAYRQMRVVPKSIFLGDGITLPVPVDPEQVDLTIKKLARKKDWSRYFELKNFYADLRGKEACTVYKSQGSTYKTVFIDIGNIGTSFDPEQVARMLFVGASRASERVYFYGELPGKYRGKYGHAYQQNPSPTAALPELR